MVDHQVALQHEIAHCTEQTRRQQLTATMTHNIKQAAQQHEHTMLNHQLESAAAVQHVQHAMRSDLLTEAPTHNSTLGPQRIRPDHYKGMSPAECKAVRETQQAQIEAHAHSQQQQQAQQRAWAAHEAAVLAQRAALEQEAATQRRASIHAYGAFLRGQAQQDTARLAHLQRVLAPSDFAQYFGHNFQTSHR